MPPPGGRAARAEMVEAPILEQWQPALPQPFRMINALLEELVDSAMLDALLARKHAPPIDEEGCLRVQGELAQVPCVASSRPLIAQLAEGVLLVASMASDAEGGGMDTEAAAGARPGNLSLWEQGQGLQQLLAFAGEPVTIASVPLHDKRKTRRVLLTTETALHALDVSRQAFEPSAWAVSHLARQEIEADARSFPRLSKDGSLIACPQREEVVLYLLPGDAAEAPGAEEAPRVAYKVAAGAAAEFARVELVSVPRSRRPTGCYLWRPDASTVSLAVFPPTIEPAPVCLGSALSWRLPNCVSAAAASPDSVRG